MDAIGSKVKWSRDSCQRRKYNSFRQLRKVGALGCNHRLHTHTLPALWINSIVLPAMVGYTARRLGWPGVYYGRLC